MALKTDLKVDRDPMNPSQVRITLTCDGLHAGTHFLDAENAAKLVALISAQLRGIRAGQADPREGVTR